MRWAWELRASQLPWQAAVPQQSYLRTSRAEGWAQVKAMSEAAFLSP